MSLYGKMAGGLIALTLVGGSAAYVASAAGSVLEAAEQTAAQLSCYVLREYNGLTEVSRLLEDLDIE